VPFNSHLVAGTSGIVAFDLQKKTSVKGKQGNTNIDPNSMAKTYNVLDSVSHGTGRDHKVPEKVRLLRHGDCVLVLIFSLERHPVVESNS
jgi:hypothetical protein